MPMLSWNNSLSVAIGSIDTQHKKLVQFVNDLHDAMLAGKGNDATGPILDGLVKYTVDHFGVEERFFSTHGYPDADSHKKEHKDLLGKVAAFHKSFKSGEAILTMDLMNFLKDWLMKHIMQIDKKYGPFLKEKGVA